MQGILRQSCEQTEVLVKDAVSILTYNALFLEKIVLNSLSYFSLVLLKFLAIQTDSGIKF